MMWSSVGYVGGYGMYEYDIYVSYHAIYDLDLLDRSISQLMPIHVHFSFFIHTYECPFAAGITFDCPGSKERSSVLEFFPHQR